MYTTGATAETRVICLSTALTWSRVTMWRLYCLSHSSSLLMNQPMRSANSTSAPMVETDWRKERFKPSMAAPIRVTLTIPMMIPSVVSAARILLARMASHAISRPSFSSVKKFTPRLLFS